MTFDFKNYNKWMYEFKKVFDHYDVSALIDEYKNNDETLFIYDVTDAIGEEIVDTVKAVLKNKYDYIAFYHGTATDNITSYFEKGLLPLDIKERNLYARKFFNQEEYPKITDELFLKATKEQFKDKNSLQLRKNRLYFTLDNDVLKQRGLSHYLIYGGEHLLHLAQNLGSQYPRELPKKLTPLILKCRIPINLLSDENMKNLAHEVIVRFLENLIYPEYKFTPPDTGVYITTKLEADNIIGCEFPKEEEIERGMRW